jgi:hypothetical protein
MGVSQSIRSKRGYLANILTFPPLIYPFQFNPTTVTDTKQLEWERRAPPEGITGRGGQALVSGVTSVVGAFQDGPGAGIGALFSSTIPTLGRTFSGAEMKQLKKEKDRTLNFSFIIDGRERQPGEPERRRGEDGHILGDLAILRTFAYPELLDLLDLVGAIFGDEADRWQRVWFNEPPPAVLVLGETSIEGEVTELKITEEQFNKDLNPVLAKVEITMIERIDSLSFIIDSVKRVGRTFYHTAWEDIGEVII